MAHESLGLIGYDSYSFVVENLERSRAFYRTRFDFRELARSSQLLTERTGEIASVFAAGGVRVHLVSPVSQASAAGRFLRRHPAGILSLNLRVKSVDQARALLVARGATLLGDDLDAHDRLGGRYRSFSIATPLGDVALKFIERSDDYETFAPGFDLAVQDTAPTNRFGFEAIDHVTCNLRTMKPALDWLKSVLGMEPFWDVSFHTEDVSPGRTSGSGLRSVVLWEPESGIKIACNEPLAPFFESSQIARFLYDNHGPGVAYVALAVPSLVSTVDELRRRRVDFLPTPAAYYRALPDRLARLKITNLAADPATLEKLEIMVDGGNDRYMLQIFARESSGLYDDERGVPFFYELIERAGDEGFGYGNFRALVESIEREQSRERAR